MRSGLCPKCQTPTVYRKRQGISIGGSNGQVHVHTSWVVAGSPVESYVCSRCGYFENYILDDRKMSEVANTWEKVIQ